MKDDNSNTEYKPIRGRVNTRYNAKRNTHRFRFTSVHPDQAETILVALKKARKEQGTEYDVVALELICMEYLCSVPGIKIVMGGEADHDG